LSSVSSAMSLQLVCDGSRAVAGSSLHQHQGKSLFPALTQDATLFCRDVVCLQDGQHEASYIGRGVHRDVYRVGDVIMKLATVATEEQLCSNFLEAEALKGTEALEQTPRLLFQGLCIIESKQCRGSSVNCITQTMNCILTTYAGPSLDELMYRYFGMPYDHTVANFLVSAYQELGVMCIDGRRLMIAYSDLHSASVNTSKDPIDHVIGQRVPCMIGNAERLSLGEYTRSVFNAVCDTMIADFELQCSMARDSSWKFIAPLINQHLGRFFRLHGKLEVNDLRDTFLNRIDLVWRDICKATAGAGCLPPAGMRSLETAASEHYAVLSETRCTSSSERLRLSCGHFFDDLREECSVCQQHYADRDANMRQRHTRRLSCGHFFDDLREECSLCQKHHADRDANMRQRHT
jgi:hypothetical protein